MMEQHAAGVAEVNGTRLAYEMAGTGHPLTLIHGGLVNRQLWDDQFSVFAQHYTVIRYDMRGFGDSALIKAGMPPYRSHEDLASLLQFLGIEKTHVMGLSAGGAVAIDFTLAYPEMVAALLPVAAGLSGFEPTMAGESPWPPIMQALQQGEIDRAVEISLRYFTDGPARTPEQVNARARERVREMTSANYQLPTTLEALWPQPMLPPASQRLAEIRVPTLIIYGDQDAPEIAEIARFLASEIKGAKQVVIPNTAHHLNLEQPEEFNRVVLDFLAALPQP